MYSLNELLLSGCWKVEETTHHEPGCLMYKRERFPVKREKTTDFADSNDYQQAMGPLPMAKRFRADHPSGIERKEFGTGLLFELPSRPEFGSHTNEQFAGYVNAETTAHLMGQEVSSEGDGTPLAQTSSSPILPNFSSQMQGPALKLKRSQKKPMQTAQGPMPTNNVVTWSQETHPEGLRPFQVPKKDNNIVVRGNSCSIGNCPCICHRRYTGNGRDNLAVPSREQQRPGVIMVPVNHDRRGASMATHEPLQTQIHGQLCQSLQSSVSRIIQNCMRADDEDSESEVSYFRMATDQTKTRFKLSKRDWEKIPIKTFPSGGRLLGGDWTQVFSAKVKKNNPWCRLRFKNNHVRSENSRKLHSAPFFRGAGECKLPGCGVKMQFVIQEERGRHVDVTCIGNICHTIR